MTAAAKAVGGPNFLRRWVFDNGAVTWSVGYAITLHRTALDADELNRIEWTWSEHPARKPSRPGLVEGIQKFTYYISEVRELSPGLHLFRHVCRHPHTENNIHEIDIIWDARSAMPTSSFTVPSWPAAWLPGREDTEAMRHQELAAGSTRRGAAAVVLDEPPRKHPRFFG